MSNSATQGKIYITRNIDGMEYVLKSIHTGSIKTLETKLKELLAHKEICFCAFCEDNIERTWDDLKSHMKNCQKHPLFITREKLKQSIKIIKHLDNKYLENNLEFIESCEEVLK